MANFLRFAAFFVLVAALTGAALFVREARDHGPVDGARADAIVVLTGGPGRVATAVTLLEDQRGERLLISGVNPGSPVGDIAAAAGASQALFDCCVDVGLEAADTSGNASETARWAAERRYDSLIVVTSDYHMPRALLELQAAMPDTSLVAFAVPAPAPWSSAAEARRWMTEYFKYSAVYMRERLAGRGQVRA
jgi:uncharacterized SAM-binding protein YcdF (DUF218 family)